MVFLRQMGEHFDDLGGGDEEDDEDGKSAADGEAPGTARDAGPRTTLQNGLPVK